MRGKGGVLVLPVLFFPFSPIWVTTKFLFIKRERRGDVVSARGEELASGNYTQARVPRQRGLVTGL